MAATSVAELWTAVGTVALAIIAAAAGVVAWVAFLTQSEQLRMLEEDRRSEQARLVNAWVQNTEQFGDAWRVTARVRNDSAVPVRCCKVIVEVPGESPSIELGIMEPHSMHGPGIMIGADQKDKVSGIALSFIDASQRQWYRRGNGDLRQIQSAKTHWWSHR